MLHDTSAQRPTNASPFLRAEWRRLAILNFAADPDVLQSYVPRGTELDAWEGRTFVSLVGFLFLDTRVFGVPIPFHRNFEEVNLRFYVRRRAAEGWRRGVVFIKEIVPRVAIAWVARRVYNENYVALPMRHQIEHAFQNPARECRAGRPRPSGRGSEKATDHDNSDGGCVRGVSYEWTFAGRPNTIRVVATAEPSLPADGAFEQFIVEHYWGYTVQRDGSTMEYRVEHPPWRIAPATEARLDCDAAGLYGEPFAAHLSRPPDSALLAEGSKVTVYRGVRL